MKCPLLLVRKDKAIEARADIWTDCLKAECAWWNERFGMCSQALAAYLAGVADRRAEVREEMQERR